jgi:hypothetical protein
MALDMGKAVAFLFLAGCFTVSLELSFLFNDIPDKIDGKTERNTNTY